MTKEEILKVSDTARRLATEVVDELCAKYHTTAGQVSLSWKAEFKERIAKIRPAIRISCNITSNQAQVVIDNILRLTDEVCPDVQ